MTPFKMHGLQAATHTPFNVDGEIEPDVIEHQCRHLLDRRVTSVFINGSTGESHSLSTLERRLLAERWLRVTAGTNMRVIVHIGSNCLRDAADLAAHAQTIGAAAVAMLAPSYFRPATLSSLIDCCQFVARAARDLPFYFYHIPALTHVQFPMEEFLNAASEKIPNLAGIKFTNPDLMAYQLAQRAAGGRFDLPWGCDEFYLAALALGAQGAIGSTYNFAPGIYQRMHAAFLGGDLPTARDEQFRSVQLVRILSGRGYLGAAKALMAHLGIPVGPARLPNRNPDQESVRAMLAELDDIGFFAWKDDAPVGVPISP